MHGIKCCRICECEKIETFFDLGNQPFANALVCDKMVEDAAYPLSLSWCPECRLVQLNHTANPGDLFSQYVWVTSTSSTAKEYAETFCNAVLQHAEDFDKNAYILEIASNDGTFLKPFITRGYRVLGIDPAENIVEMAVSEGIDTKCGFFGEAPAQGIISEHGFPSVVIARNVLPHVANLHDFVKGMCRCMKDNTLLVIEIHYAKPILKELHYDSIYHEHLCYFSLKSLERLLQMYGLHIYDVMKSPISGGSVVVFARLSQCEKTSEAIEYEKQEKACHINELETWNRFAETAFMHRKLFMELLNEEIGKGCKIVGYGASARSSTMLNFCGIDTKQIKIIADQNPMKHKLFTPGTHIPIDNPERVLVTEPDTVAILAWNFLEEIVAGLWKQFGFRGKLLIPFPYPPKLVKIEEFLNV
ncbi:hypothetical protein GMMP1_370033 [Candidatus Magnetomoraceae bacterium gMMP-1]